MFFNRQIVNPDLDSVERSKRSQFEQNDDDDQIFYFEVENPDQQENQSSRELKITPRGKISQTNFKTIQTYQQAQQSLYENNIDFYEPGLRYDEQIRKLALQKQLNLIKQQIDKNQPQLHVDTTIEYPEPYQGKAVEQETIIGKPLIDVDTNIEYPEPDQEKDVKKQQTIIEKPLIHVDTNIEHSKEKVDQKIESPKEETIFFEEQNNGEEEKESQLIEVESSERQKVQQTPKNIFIKSNLINDEEEEIIVEQSKREESDEKDNSKNEEQETEYEKQQIVQSEGEKPKEEQEIEWPFPPNLETNFIPTDPDMKRYFLTTPIPVGFNLQCYIIRSRSGLSRLYPIYHLYTQQGQKYLLSAKKLALNSCSKYVISMEKDKFSTKSNFYLGKLSSNFMGTDFSLWDNGLNPKKTKNTMSIRCQLGSVHYASCHKAGPRRMRVLIPKVDPESSVPKQFMPLNSSEGIQQEWEKDKTDYIDLFVNKFPTWNKSIKAYELDFYGRVDKPSVKNFQLIKLKDREKLFFQFGRITDDQFNLDFTWPFSPLQAIQICVSSFDFKFACE